MKISKLIPPTIAKLIRVNFRLSVIILFALITSSSFGQINYSYNWEPAGLGSWTGTGGSLTTTRITDTPCAGSGSIRQGLFSCLTASGSNCAVSSGPGAITSPNLGTAGGFPSVLSFLYKVTNSGGAATGANNVYIEVQYSINASTWTTIYLIDNTNHNASTSCATVSISNFVAPAGVPLYFRFLTTRVNTNNTNVQFNVTFDNFSFVETTPPPCTTPVPGNTLSTSTTVCNNTPFTLSLQNTTSGATVTYQWQSATNLAFTTGVTNLGIASTQVTSQTANKYYRCRVTCSAGPVTVNSNPILVSMATNPCTQCTYCAAQANNTGFEKISNVTLNTLNQNSSANAGYENFTGLGGSSTTTIFKGDVYPLSVTLSNPYSFDEVIVFIDYNQDGDFTDAGETVYNSPISSGPFTTSITIPNNPSVLTGVTRLRVRLHDTSGNANATSCGNSQYGQVEDYCITVSEYIVINCNGLPTPGNTLSNASNPVCNDISFILSLQNPTTEAGITYQWQSATAVGGPWNPIGGATSNTLVTTTNATTFYRCAVTCNVGGTTNSNPVQVNGKVCPCTPPLNNGCTYANDAITNFTFSNINNSSGCTPSGFTNYTSSVPCAQVNQGTSVPFSITSPSGVPENVYIWIDFNDNAILTDAGEFVYSGVKPGNPNTFTDNFIIPGCANPGAHIMRVRIEYNTIGGPCANVGRGPDGGGETEDYCVFVNSIPIVPAVAKNISGLSTSPCNVGVVLTLASGYAGSVQWESSTDIAGPYTEIANATGSSITISGSAITTYYFRARFTGQGCTPVLYSNIHTLNFTTGVMNITSTAGSSNICRGVPITLTASGAGPYSWNTGATTASITVSPLLQLSTYSVSTNIGGCVANASVSYNVSGPVAQASAPSIVCPGGAVNLMGTLLATPSVGYTMNSIPYTGVTCPTNAGPSNDDQVISANIGFTFTYFGIAYTNLGISSNANIQIGNGSGSANNPAYSDSYTPVNIPSASVPNNMIALAWGDFNPSLSGSITYGVSGPVGSRIFTVCYVQVPAYGGGNGRLNGQIRLYEGSNRIEIHIQNVGNGTSGTGINKVVGIENANGTVGYMPAGYSPDNWTASNIGWSFVPIPPPAYNTNGPVNYSWTATNGFTSNLQNASNIINAPTTYTLQVSDNTCSSSSQAVVNTYPAPSVNTFNGGPYCEGGDIQFFTSGSGTSGPAQAGTLTVNVNGSGFMDEVSWEVRNSSNVVIASVTAGTYTFGSSNTIVVNPAITDYPVSFNISTVGTENDNDANYSIVCSLGASVILSSSITGGATQTNPGLLCNTQAFTLGYSWIGPNSFTSNQASPVINNSTIVNSGDYIVTIIDGNGCQASYTSNVQINSNPVVDYVNVTGETCPGSADGIIEIGISSGDGSYSTTNGGMLTSFDSPATFTPVAAGTYSFSITDGFNCSTSTSATVGTLPNLPPTLTCPGNMAVNTDAGVCGAVVIYEPIADDACPGIGSINQTAGLPSGSIFPVGTTVNSFTVTDALGLTATCSFSITVTDTENPAAICQNILVQLDASGNASISAAQVNNGSNDACGVQSITAVPTSFTVANVGANTVTLTVTDNNGNISTCNSTVTVEDNIDPVALCQSITVQLDPSGNASITASQIDNGSNDASGIQSTTVSPSSFTCANVGTNTVTLTVTDNNGNVSTCTATVTVVDNVDPVALCQNITVQLDASGNASVAASQINNGSNDACGIQSMTVSPSSFSCANVGANTVTLTVTDNNGNISTCTATVTVQDNVAPVALCQNLTIQLNASGAASITASQIDNGSGDACGIQSMTLSQTNFTCAHVGANTVTLTVTDNNGNVSTCTATVTVQDNVAPVALCQSITVQLDASGNASITAAQIDNGSNDACGIQSMVLSQTNFACAHVGPNTVTLTVTDNNGNVSICTATVTVVDNVGPVALCQNITVQLNASGNTSITASQIDNGSNDACGIQSMTVSPNSFTCANVGANTVTLTVTDNNGNVSTCTASVTVEDNVDPVAVCQSISIQLDASGNASITASQIDNGSNDACGIQSLSVSPNSFTCANVGANTVTLTVTDNNGNVSTCTATVTVQDNVAPIAVCQNLTVQLNASGNASVTAAQVNNGSSDNCSIASMSVSPNSFTCSNVGANTVTFTVTDVNGNSSTCTATVTVQDNVAPVALCQNITVQLDASGNTSITASQIDNGSNDACGIQSMTVSPNSFTCANVGANTVTLTVTDNNGNVSTCAATVTVQDNVAPVALCQFVTIYLDANGNASTSASAVDNGSNDACGIQSLSLSQTNFTCANLGNNPVILTVTDIHGNSSTCNSIVTVVDNILPVITCPSPISVNNSAGLCGANVTYTVPGTDNCSAVTVTQIAGLGSGALFPVGVTVNSFLITDASGNTSTCSFSVTVTDTENPTIANVPVSFSTCNPITWIPPTVTDNCPGVQVQSSHVPGTVFPPGTTTVTYTATDAYNHVTTASFDVTVLEPSVSASSISTNRDFNNICSGENITLSVVGGTLGSGASWKWYSNTCGGTLAGTGTTITVNPVSTTTYYVRAEGTCGPSSCTSIQVVVSSGNPTGTLTFNTLPPYGAPGITSVLSVNPVVGATYYQWSTNNGQIGGVLFNNLTSPVQTGVPTVNITFVQSQQNYQIRVLAGNACGRTGQANTHIRGTVAAPTSLTGPTQVCPGQTATYTVSAIPSQSGGNGVTYNWVLIPANAGAISGTGLTRTVTFAAGFTTAQLCVNGISNFGLSGTPLCISISTNAPIPGAISGNAVPCSGSTSTYNISAVPNATSYIWTVLGNVVTGQNGTSANITFPSGAFSGNVCVQSVSACGTSAPSCLAVVSGAPGNPGPISGPTQGICGATNVNYSLGTSGATYNWILPAGVTPSGPTNLNSINVNFSGTFAGGNIVVQVQYACGSPVSSSLAVSGEPTTPIVSPATICANSTELYFATSTGATGYNWTVTNAVDAFCTNPPVCSQYYAEWGPGGGSFSVIATNGCGTSAPFSLSTNCRTIETGELETKVYPNPTTGQFVVEISSYAGGNHNLTITDLSGRVVMMKDVKATSGMNQFEMDLGFANAGLYMLYVKDADGKISVTKIVVE